MESKITPVQVFPHTATTLKIVGVQVRKLGEEGSAMVAWQLFNDKDLQIQSGAVELKGAEYSAWGSDDAYVLGVVLSKLGLTAPK